MGEGAEEADRLEKRLRFCAVTTPTQAHFTTPRPVYLTVGIKSARLKGLKDTTPKSVGTGRNTRASAPSPLLITTGRSAMD